MNIQWLGHACFMLEEKGYRIVTDPYSGVEGCGDIHVTADAVYCSHEHFDHNYREGVQLRATGESPFTVREIAAFHDEVQGAKRGKNTIRVFTAGGVSVCHLGDLGHPLDSAQLEAIGAVDVLLAPVGGIYTLDDAGAKAVCDTVGAKCIVPMHYRGADFGLSAVSGVEPFLARFDPAQICRLPGDAFSYPPENGGMGEVRTVVLVPRYCR